MASATTRVKRLYGAHPLHLLTLVASFAFVGYVISLLGVRSLWNSHVWWQSMIVWFLGAIVLHDVVLFPIYALADRSLGAGWRAVSGKGADRLSEISPINYIRLPVMASGLLLLMFFPGIIQQGKGSYLRATGLTQAPYLERWLLLTAVFFGVSALAYAVRSLLVRRHRGSATGGADPVVVTDGIDPTGATDQLLGEG